LDAEVTAGVIEAVATTVAKDGVFWAGTSVGSWGKGEDRAEEDAGDAAPPGPEAALAARDGDGDVVTPGWVGAGWTDGGWVREGWIGVWTIGVAGVGIAWASGEVRVGFAERSGRAATAADDDCETSVSLVAVGLTSSGSLRPPGRADVGVEADCATRRASVGRSAEPAIEELAGWGGPSAAVAGASALPVSAGVDDGETDVGEAAITTGSGTGGGSRG